MHEFGFGHKFHHLKYFEVEFFFHIPWVYYKFEAPLDFFVDKSQFTKFLSYFKKNSNNYVFNIPTCTLLAPSSKIYRFFLKNILKSLFRSLWFSNVYDYFLYKIQSQYEVLNHSYLNLCMIIQLCTWPCLHPMGDWNLDEKTLNNNSNCNFVDLQCWNIFTRNDK